MKSKFEVIEQYKNGFNEIGLINNSNGERITVIPSLGARLNEAVLAMHGKSYSVLKRLTASDMISRDELFNNTKLFPFAGRIKNGTYKFNGTRYSLPLNYPEEQNACHGFIYDKSFRMIDCTLNEKEASITFEYVNRENVQGYPFDFSIIVIYTLRENSEVRCTTKVLNNSVGTLPFSDGWHHYFCLNGSINNLLLKTDATHVIELDQYGIPTGNENAVDAGKYISINDGVFDNVFRVNKKDTVITSLHSPAEDITLSVWQQAREEKYRYLVIYTPPDRQSIAIEPVTSNINSFNTKQDLICLEPRQSWQADCGFFLE